MSSNNLISEPFAKLLLNLLDHAESESVRHRVAVDMLNMTLKFMEFKDVEQRIRKLEDTITE